MSSVVPWWRCVTRCDLYKLYWRLMTRDPCYFSTGWTGTSQKARYYERAIIRRWEALRRKSLRRHQHVGGSGTEHEVMKRRQSIIQNAKSADSKSRRRSEMFLIAWRTSICKQSLTFSKWLDVNGPRRKTATKAGQSRTNCDHSNVGQ
jgi:hypothetical protein